MMRFLPTMRPVESLAALLLVWALVAPALHAEHGDHGDHEGSSETHDCVYCHPAQGGSLVASGGVVLVAGDELVETMQSVDEDAPLARVPESTRPRGPPVTA